MTAKEAVAVEPITKTPGVLGGAACIRGRRIAVWMLVQAHRLGFTNEELQQRYDPPLTAEELAAVWQYNAQHRTEIDAAIQDNERTLETDLGPLAKKDANGDTTAPDMLSQGVEWLTRRGAEEMRVARERILGA